MGYTTEFSGEFELNKPATPEQVKYIENFSCTRRMQRSSETLKHLYKGDHGLDGEYGKEGEYFCKNDGNYGQDRDESVIDYNKPPSTQPGLWCQWALTEDGNFLEWDGGEKFYCYVEWLEYLIKNFFSKWGIALNGKILYQGEDMTDRGKIICKNNKITVIELE